MMLLGPQALIAQQPILVHPTTGLRWYLQVSNTKQLRVVSV